MKLNSSPEVRHNRGRYTADILADAKQEEEEMEKPEEGKGMKLSDEQQLKLKEEFPEKALSTDNSRGFPLVSIKAMYVIERLNDVFGVFGWSYEFTEPVLHEGEYVAKITLIVYDEEHKPYHTIAQYGGKKVIKSNHTDAYKSSITDGLTKCASILGIGHTVFKGQTQLDKKPQQEKPQEKPQEQPQGDMPPQGDLSGILNFGKYKGKSLIEINKINSSYLPWLLDKSDMFKDGKNQELRNNIEQFLDEERFDDIQE